MHCNELNAVNPLTHRGWNDLVQASPEYSFFHTSNWARVLVESNGCRPHYLGIQDGQRFSVLLPLMGIKSWMTGNRGYCLPFSDYCDPINDGYVSTQEIVDTALHAAEVHGWKSVEIRGGKLVHPDAILSSRFNRHTLSLEGTENEIFSKFRSNYRRKIKSGLKNQPDIEISHSAESMGHYYELHCITRKRHGLPYQPKKFFQKIYEHILSQGLGFVVLLSHKGRYVAGDVFFLFGEKALYKFGALDIRYQHLKPSYLVMWHAIKWLSQNGYKQLCFGRTDFEDNGLNQFKTGWGTRKERLYYYTVGSGKSSLIQNRNKLEKMGTFLFRRMPDPVLRISGSFLYRHFG